MLRKTAIAVAVAGLIGIGALSPASMYGLSDVQLMAHEHGGKATTEQPGGTGQKTDKENAGNRTCPVSGEDIDEKAKVTYEYKGRIYNFCCPECVEEFKKDPGKYIEKMEKDKSVTDGHDHSGSGHGH